MARPVDKELRSRVLRAAGEQFAGRGFAATTMADVGEAAGVTKGGVYFHFRSKEELFFAALDQARAELRGALAAQEAGGGAGRERVRGFLRTYLQHHFERPALGHLLRVLGSEMRSHFTAELREDARQEQRRLRSRLRELLADGVQDGSLFVPDPAQAAFLLASALEGAVGQWITAPADAEPFCDAGDLADALVRLYAAQGPATRRAESAEAREFDLPF